MSSSPPAASVEVSFPAGSPAKADASAAASSARARWTAGANVFEYGAAANPEMAPIPVLVHPPALHESGPTRVIPFDINDTLDIDTQCTSPNLMASFVRVVEGESIATAAVATSQAFYVIRGSGETSSAEHGVVRWGAGDLFVVPVTPGALTHKCTSADSHLSLIHI